MKKNIKAGVSLYLFAFLALTFTFLFIHSNTAAIEKLSSSDIAVTPQTNQGGKTATLKTATLKIMTLKIMTINLRNSSDFWEERFPLVADEIVRLAPDLIGFQEFRLDINQPKVLMSLIQKRAGAAGLKYDKYEHLKTGKEMFFGEGIGIFSRFPIEKNAYSDLKNGRVVLFSRIKIEDGLTVDFYNTHLHHQGGDKTRLPQARLIVDFEKKNHAGFPTFLTGDMNSQDSDETIKHFISNSFIDTYRTLHEDETAVIGNTSPVIISKNNSPQNFRNRIDYVFMKVPAGWENRMKIIESVICFKNLDNRGLYPSDHLGVMTTVRITY